MNQTRCLEYYVGANVTYDAIYHSFQVTFITSNAASRPSARFPRPLCAADLPVGDDDARGRDPCLCSFETHESRGRELGEGHGTFRA